MLILRNSPGANGAYPAPQTWNKPDPPQGYVIIPDTIDMSDFYDYNGFVNLQIEGDTVTGYTPNTVAWEEWKASQTPPEEPEPTIEEYLVDLDYRLSLTELGVTE